MRNRCVRQAVWGESDEARAGQERPGRDRDALGAERGLPRWFLVAMAAASVLVVAFYILERDFSDLGGKIVVGVVLLFGVAMLRGPGQALTGGQNSPRRPKPKRGAPLAVQGRVTRSGA